jgi:glycosyltransferase involved in cell wall biosynthesis
MISVIMPVYNNLGFLPQCIESILGQTYGDFEFIILDDMSDEPVSSLVESYEDKRIKLIKNKENIGLTKSLNICLDAARGDIIARQDSDDISLPERFEKEVAKLDEGYDMVSCWGRTVHNDYPKNKRRLRDPYLDRTVRSVRSSKDFSSRLAKENCILGPAAMFTREVFERIGYYDETLYYAQDYNYWIRISKFFKIGVVEEELYLRRRNLNSVRSDKRHEEKKKDIIGRLKSRADSNPVLKK